MACPDLTGRLESLGRVGWRHPHIDDGDVRLLPLDEGQQLRHVSGLSDDSEAGRLQGGGEGLAEEHRIIGQDDAEGRAVVDHAGETELTLGSGAPPWWNRIDPMMPSAVGRQASMSA